MNSKPLVSILIPTFNRKNYLSKSLRSALDQDYQNFEVIVHDDATTDGTKEYLSKQSHPKLKVIRTENNHGMIGGWNYILEHAKGQYIKYLADDDLLEKNCLSIEVRAFQENPSAAIVTCQRKFIDEKGKTIYTNQFSNKSELVDGRQHGHWILTSLRENKIGEPTAVLFRKKDILKAGLFDPLFSQFADFELWIRILEFGDLFYLNKPLCSFRVHSGSNTSSAHKDGRFISEIFKLIDKYYQNSHYRQVFSLSESDRSKVISLKTSDTLKNIKDLFIQGKLTQANTFFKKLNQFVTLDRLYKETINHLLK